MASLVDAIYRIISLSSNRQLSGLSIADAENWIRYHEQVAIENWYYYYGFHSFFFTRFDGEDENQFIQRVKTSTIENHVAPIIDLIASYLYDVNTPVKRYVHRNGSPDKQLNDILKNNVWNMNDMNEIDDSKAINALVTGFTVLKRLLYDYRTEQPMVFPFSKGDVGKYGYVKKELIDSINCLPLPYVDENGVINPRRLGAILTITKNDNYLGSSEIMRLIGRTSIQSEVLEYIDDKIWLKFLKSPSSGWVQINVNPGTPYQNRNQYGRVEIPFTVYKNTGDPFFCEGNSDVDKIKTLNRELDELGNADKNTILYHSYPILMGLNGAMIPNDFVRTKNAFLSLPNKDQKLEYLSWEGKLDESSARQEQLRRVMSNTTGISMISRGFLKDIGQIRSGPPLKALFSSDRATMNRKFTAFSTAEKKDMRADLLFWAAHSNDIVNVDKSVSFNIDFNPDFLGIDKLLEAEIDVLQLQAGAITIEEIVKDEHPEWSDDEVAKTVATIVKQRQQQQVKVPQQSPDKAALRTS